jgi:hypothetical protein
MIWGIVAFLALWDGVCWLLIGAAWAPVVPGGWAAVAAMAAALFLPLLVLARGFGGGAYPAAATRVWVFRPFWYGQLALPFLAGAAAAGFAAGLPFGAGGAGARWVSGAVGVAMALLALWGFAGTRRLVVRPLDLALDGLPAALDGLRIAQLSDLHVGPHTPRRHLRRVREAVERSGAEMVVFTGDQVDDYARDVEPFGAAFGGVAAPLGVYAIAGNHDVIAGWAAVRAGLERLGMTVLVNAATPVERGGVRFWVAGTGDPAGAAFRRGGGADAAPDVARTLAGIRPGEWVLALAHNPALWPALAERGVPLTLSGHTHHGQLSIPRLGWSIASPFLELAMGTHRRGASVLYINPGTNYWGIPFRIGALPEVTVITLRRA